MSGLAMSDTVAVTVHGVEGAVDLVVPLAASVADVAREYAVQSGLAVPPSLMTATGRQLPGHAAFGSTGLVAGDVLVAVAPSVGPRPIAAAAPPSPSADQPRSRVGLWFACAGAAGLAAGYLAAGDGSFGIATSILLGVAAVIGLLPFGAYAEQRAAIAPAFGGAAAYVVAWEPGLLRTPVTFGIAALAAAVVAGLARVLSTGRAEIQNVWIASGLAVFGVAGVGVFSGLPAQVAWAALVMLATLAARFVPSFAIDVPDQLLIDIERLAVTAWSARDRMTGRRGRMVIPEAGIRELLARGARIVDAACAAILVVTVVAVPSLFATARFDVDRQGAAALVLFAGGGLLLAARSYRHVPARTLLRIAGVYCWAAAAQRLLVEAPGSALLYVALGAAVIATGAVLAAIATGRGWRSVWWARRAEVAEVLCGAFAVASLVVAVGLVRHLWELGS